MNNIQFQRGAIEAGDCVSNGWRTVVPNYWIFFGMTSLLMVVTFVVSFIPFVPIVFQIFVAAPVSVGIYYALLRAMRGDSVDFGMMFKGFEKYVQAMVVGVVSSIPQIIVTILSFALNLGSFATNILQQRTGRGNGSNFVASNDAVPMLAGGLVVMFLVIFVVYMLFSIAWGITFFFAFPILSEHDLSPIEAIQLSARAGWSNPGGIILLIILQVLIAIAGVIALCFGIFFVVPIIFAASAVAYRQVFPLIESNFNFTPPPPNAYGSNFGSGM